MIFQGIWTSIAKKPYIFVILQGGGGSDEIPHSAQNVTKTLKKLRTSKGDYEIKQWFSSIAPLFKMGTSLKGKNWLPEGANSFLK